MQTPKPIFESQFPGFSPFDAEALRILVRQITNPAPRIAEIGSWLGDGSTRILIEELQGRGTIYCVDTWDGTPGVERHSMIAQNYDVLATFRHNVGVSGGGDCVNPMVMSSDAAATIVSDRMFDLVFLDGDHSLESTRRDIAGWKRKVAPGGILCGHDCETRVTDENRALLESAKERDAIQVEGKSFEYYHPGVILAVDETFGTDAILFAEEPVTLSDGQTGPSTIWSMVL